MVSPHMIFITTNVLGSIFNTKPEHSLICEPWVGNKESCLIRWKKRGGLCSYNYINPRQNILKKILFRAPHLLFGSSSKHKLDPLLNDKYTSLKSLIPSTDKDDEVSILDDTIKYMKELERRVKEVEASQVNLDEEFCVGKRPQEDAAERTSDNASISISFIQKDDISIEITCPYKQCVLLDLTNLKFDTHSVQSSIFDAILCVTIKAKIKGFGGLSVGMIRQVLQRVVIRSGRVSFKHWFSFLLMIFVKGFIFL